MQATQKHEKLFVPLFLLAFIEPSAINIDNGYHEIINLLGFIVQDVITASVPLFLPLIGKLKKINENLKIMSFIVTVTTDYDNFVTVYRIYHNTASSDEAIQEILLMDTREIIKVKTDRRDFKDIC